MCGWCIDIACEINVIWIGLGIASLGEPHENIDADVHRLYFNSAIDTGRYDDLSIDQVRQEIRAGTIFRFLTTKLGDDIDFSILDTKTETGLLFEWQDMEAAIPARKKFGVENRGLPLLVAYLLEGIQRRARALS